MSCAERSGSGLARGASNVKEPEEEGAREEDLRDEARRKMAIRDPDGAFSTRHGRRDDPAPYTTARRHIPNHQSECEVWWAEVRRCGGVVEEGIVTTTVSTVSRRIGTGSNKEKRFVSVRMGRYIHLIKPRSTLSSWLHAMHRFIDCHSGAGRSPPLPSPTVTQPLVITTTLSTSKHSVSINRTTASFAFMSARSEKRACSGQRQILVKCLHDQQSRATKRDPRVKRNHESRGRRNPIQENQSQARATHSCSTTACTRPDPT